MATKTKPEKKSLEALKLFESKIDVHVSEAPILNYPLRSILSNLFIMIDHLFNGSRFKIVQSSPDRDKGSALVSRLSYVLPILIQKCPLEPGGESAHDALSPFLEHPELFADIHTIVQYGHFCEIMPEVRKGYYSVDGNEQDGFSLKHRTEGFASYEERDIALSELSIPFHLKPPDDDSEVYDEFTKDLKQFDYGKFAILVKKYFENYSTFAFELPIMTEQGYIDGIGVSWQQFNQFRAAWSAIAEYCARMASAVARLINRTDQYENSSLIGDLWEWGAVALKSTFLDGTVIGLTYLSNEEYDRISKIFSVDVTQQIPSAAGDGFFPPLIRFSNFVLFNPDIVRIMMSSRNIPYAINRLDNSLYSTLLSHHMEPALLQSVKEILDQIPGLEIKLNRKWSSGGVGGEFDLLAFHASSNSIFQIQAKAPIPPQGARMVQQIESRVLEGIEQLNRFNRQDQTIKDSVLTSIFQKEIHKPEIVSCILCRTSFGTEKIWALMSDILAVNLHILSRTVLNVIQDQQTRFSFMHLANSGRELLEQYVRDVVIGWESQPIELNAVRISVPLLILDYQKIESYQLRWFPEGDTADRLRLAFAHKAATGTPTAHAGAVDPASASKIIYPPRSVESKHSDDKARRKEKRKAAKVARKVTIQSLKKKRR